ncbi:MAG TPA: hypothetical protein VLC46_21800 [Thermoanaerobaculia bacterium]|jgi:hypothetical protein|nr:hypothetical protein [Thermoanaerobaculia bacterium]
MRPIVVAVLAAFLAVAARAAIRVTPEQTLLDPVAALQEGDQVPLTVATDGDQFLVFWGNYVDDNLGGMKVALIDSDGRQLSFRFIPGTKNAVFGVNACWTGSVYFAEWFDYQARTISTATFSRNGDTLQPPTVVLQGANLFGDSLAWNGNRALVLYSNDTLKGALFDADGSLIRAEIPMPSIGNGNPYSDAVPALISDGNEFAAVWQSAAFVSDPNGYMGQRLVQDFHLLRITGNGDVDGQRVDIGRVELTNGFGVAYGGGVYAIDAVQSPLSLQPQLVRFVIDAHSGSVTRLPTVDVAANGASILWSGSRFVAYWPQYSSEPGQGGYPGDAPLALKTLSFSGAAEDTAPEPATPVAFDRLVANVVLTSNGRNVFGAWAPGQLPESPLYGKLFDGNAAATVTADPPRVVSIGWSRQFLPSIATSGTDSLAVWIDVSGDPYSGRLLGARISGNGAPIDGTPFEIAPIVPILGASSPTVVFTGTVYLVAWVDGAYDSPTVVKVGRVGRDGSLGAPVSLGQGYAVSAATNGTTTLVVAGSAFGLALAGCRFDEIGNSIDKTPIVISADGSNPLVASNGTDFFVAWNEGDDFYIDPIFSPPPNLYDVFGARVSASGAVDAAPLPIAIGTSDQILTGLASDGRDYLVAYSVNDYRQSFLAAKHILREGILDGATATDDGQIMARDITLGGSYFIGPSGALSGDASGYWTAFTEAGATVIMRTDLRGVPRFWLAPFGTASSLALAQIPGGLVWIAYARRVDNGRFAGTSQIFVRSAAEVPSVPRSHAAPH